MTENKQTGNKLRIFELLLEYEFIDFKIKLEEITNSGVLKWKNN